jgi:2-polyprenyl-3-methyl-5-hydroxy-6-metoxy-1,4-benzoquinol methylase
MIKPVGSTERVQDVIAALVQGKRVLDIGCVDHSASHAGEDTWLHGHIEKHAAYVLGLDIAEPEVEKLRKHGHNVIAGDAITADLQDTFDVVTAGELIEHLDAPGPFLRNMCRHLSPDGRLLLTTPNVFFGLHWLESLAASPYQRWNPEHVAWYCYFTLENLLERNGMHIEQCIYFTRSRKLRRLLRWLRVGCRSWCASTMLVIAKKHGA